MKLKGGKAKIEVAGELFSINEFDMARVQPEKKLVYYGLYITHNSHSHCNSQGLASYPFPGSPSQFAMARCWSFVCRERDNEMIFHSMLA